MVIIADTADPNSAICIHMAFTADSTDISCSILSRPEVLYKQAKVALDSFNITVPYKYHIYQFHDGYLQGYTEFGATGL